MPPKKSIHTQRASTRHVSASTIPIYEILSSRDIREPVQEILPRVETVLKEDPVSLKMSLLNMLVRVCGLEEYSTGIEAEDTISALEDIIQKAYEVKMTEVVPLILQEKERFHKEFIKRVKEFLRAVISEEVGAFHDQKLQFNQSFLSWLQILTNSRLRAIRNASIKFTQLLLEQEIALYEQYHEKRQSKKALNISKSISYYLEKIVSPRCIDVDQSIRETAFGVTFMILEQLEGEVMGEQLLHKIFTPLFGERIEVLELFVKLLLKLLQKCKDPRPLAGYLKEHLNKLIELSRNSQYTGTNVQALKIVELLHHHQPSLKILNRDYLISVLENFAPSQLYYGLHAAIDVFYQSLYKTPEQLELNSPIVLLQIINLLMGVSGQKHMTIILGAFFNSTRKIQPTKIFNIDNMFNLLVSETFRDERNTNVQLKEKEISILITIIVEWIKHCSVSFLHAIKDKPTYQKILQTFNNHILVNCKQLFFEKMTKHQEISEKYLAMFGQIHCPTLNFGQIQNYLDFVCEKVEKLFAQDLENTKVYREVVNVLHNLGKDEKLGTKYSAKSLITKLPLLRLTSEDSQIKTEDIYRLSAVLSKFPIQQLTKSENFLANLISVFARTRNDTEKNQIIVIFHFLHHCNFMELFIDHSQGNQQIYKSTRDNVLRMYVNILGNADENLSVKLAAFRALTFMLRVIASKKFEEAATGGRINAYELSNDEMRVVYEFVTRQLFDSDSLDYSSMDITRFMQRMSLQAHDIKSDIIRFLFELYEESYVFTCHPESVKFIITMIKAEYEFHRSISSKSYTLPMSLDLTKDVDRRLNRLLDLYLQEEIKESNASRLIYWRLCYEVFSLSREDDRFEIIMDKLLSSYFSKRKTTDPFQRKRLVNKIMIFILHAVDKILERREYIQLDVYENIFRKISRRVEKEILIRVKEFFIEKTQGIQSNYVRNFLETLESIAKVSIKKERKSKKNEDESGSESSSEDDRQKRENIESDDENRRINDQKTTNRKSQRVKSKSTKHPSVMMEVEEESDDGETVPHRNLRSQTKKKIK